MNTRIVTVDPTSLRLLELNARYMTHEQFTRLVENVRRDGKLTSVPFACREADGEYRVLSGNHRVMAAKEAGLEAIDVMVTDDELTEEQKVAIQLSHNAIEGQDDPATLKLLYEAIDDLDLKAYSGLDDKTLELLAKVELEPISEARLDFQTLNLLFLPHELDRMQGAWDAARKLMPPGDTAIASMEHYDRFMDALDATQRSHNTTSAAFGLMRLLDVFEAHIEDLAEVWADGRKNARWLPLAPIFGGVLMPAEAALVVKRAVDKMQQQGEVEPGSRWKALELWAADYLAGA